MSYKAYLIQQFDTTHENIYFKELSEKLSEIFRPENTLSILIGNLNVNGNQLDALFIRDQQITVIDFKNYGGALTFSVNNHWAIINKNETILVAGGSYNRNPYQQVNQYRRTLIDFLNKENLFHDRNNINLGHISALVLFQQPIEFNKDHIPKNLAFFHITDNRYVGELLNNIRSKELNLSEKEISSLIKSFNINEDNLFDSSQIVVNKNSWDGKIKYDLIKRLIRYNPKVNNEIANVLNYYNIMLDLESIRGSVLSVNLSIPYEISEDNETIKISFNSNENFLKELDKNKKDKFPKNLFIGVPFQIGSQSKILLYQIILPAEINNEKDFAIFRVSNFELYSPSFHELNLSENTIDEFNTKIAQFNTLKEKTDYLISELEALQMVESKNLTLSFTDKNLTNSQVSSELNRLRNFHLDELSQNFISNFLLRKPVQNTKYPCKDFIRITNMNTEQEEAVRASLQNTLTVITGPPGTGKTQVVLNIISNAIINNKKVLFASKNNKAVDNVIERFVSDYLLRIGSNEIIETSFKPKLHKFIKNSYEQEEKISFVLQNYNNILIRLDEIQEILAKLEKLPEEIKEHKNYINYLNVDFENYKTGINTNEKALFLDQNLILRININILSHIYSILNNKNSNFINRILFKIFQQSKIIQEIINFENSINPLIIDYLNSLNPLFVDGKTSLNLLINHTKCLIDLNHNYNAHIKKRSDYLNELSIHQNLLMNKEKELDWIINNKLDLENELNLKKTELIETGKNYLLKFINNKLSETTPAMITAFMSYLGAIPWQNPKDLEYEQYVSHCKLFLEKFLAFSVTSLSIKRAIPLTNEIFDVLVIDEASQCDIASAIPLIYRAKQVVVIGDSQQLKHITSVNKLEENYVLNHLELSEVKYNFVQNSLFDYIYNLANLSNIKTHFLKEHFRCHPSIIDFSNIYFYNNELIVKTKEQSFNVMKAGIFWHDVKGITANDKNYNMLEKDAVISLCNKIAFKNPEAEIGITTPFKDQEKALMSEFNKMNHNMSNVVIQNIHKFQGDEKDIIILSLVVTKEAKESLTTFINSWSPYLLNVAVTRAKGALHIVGDFDFCKKHYINRSKILSRLAEYVESCGTIIK